MCVQILAVLHETNMGMSAASKGYALLSKYEAGAAGGGAPQADDAGDTVAGAKAQQGKRGPMPAWAAEQGLQLLRKLHAASGKGQLGLHGVGGGAMMGVCGNPECTSLSGASDGLAPLLHSCPRCARVSYCCAACADEHRHEHRMHCRPPAM